MSESPIYSPNQPLFNLLLILGWETSFPKQVTLWGHMDQPAPSMTFPFVSMGFPWPEGLFL